MLQLVSKLITENPLTPLDIAAVEPGSEGDVEFVAEYSADEVAERERASKRRKTDVAFDFDADSVVPHSTGAIVECFESPKVNSTDD